MADPLPTPPSHAFGQLTGLSSDYEENPFDAVFAGQKASGPQAAVSGLGSNGEPGSKESHAVPSTPFLSSASLLNTPPASISSLVVTPTGKSGGADGGDSYFTKVDFGTPLDGGSVIATSPAGDPHLGLRLLAEAPMSQGAVTLGAPPLKRAVVPASRMGRPRNAVVQPHRLVHQQQLQQQQQQQHKQKGMLGMVANAPAAAKRKAAGGAMPAGKQARVAKPPPPAEVREETPDDKRQQFLDRNKVAASKCRAKKKKWMMEMEHRAKELAGANAELSAQLTRLKNESDILREILLAHRDCSCVKIQQYLQVDGNSKLQMLAGHLPMAFHGHRMHVAAMHADASMNALGHT